MEFGASAFDRSTIRVAVLRRAGGGGGETPWKREGRNVQEEKPQDEHRLIPLA